MTKLKCIVVFFASFLSFVLSGCSENSELVSSVTEFEALSTYVTITAYAENSQMAYDYSKLPLEFINGYEKRLSATVENSDIYNLNSKGKTVVSDDTLEIIRKSIDLSNRVDGIFDITVYPAVKAWGFTTGNYNVVNESKRSELTRYIDYNRISINGNEVALPDGFSIDLGGCAKGYIGDKCAELLKQNGVPAAIINLGGNVRTLGSKSKNTMWTIGIDYPESTGYYATVKVGETNIISSGAYERNFRGEDGKFYHHIINPFTAAPAESNLKVVTIICNDGTKADILSTSLYAMGLEKTIEFCKNNNDFDAIILTENDEVYITENILQNFELEKEYENLSISVIKR